MDNSLFRRFAMLFLSFALCFSWVSPALAFGEDRKDRGEGAELSDEMEMAPSMRDDQEGVAPATSAGDSADVALDDEVGSSAPSSDSVDGGAARSFSPAVDFVYIDNEIAIDQDTQWVVVGFSGVESAPSSAALRYRVEGTTGELESGVIIDDAALFEFSLDDQSEWSSYVLEGVTLSEGGGESVFLPFEDASESEGSPSFDVVSDDLSEVVANGGGDSGIIACGSEGELSKASGVEEALEACGVARAESAARQLGLQNRSSSPVVVAIDPGHGGSDPGAVNASEGLRESELTWKIAEYCKERLQTYGGVQVIMTRAQDEYVSISDRVDRAVAQGADFIVSIHINSGGGTGAEVWIPKQGGFNASLHDDASRLADEVLSRLEALGLYNRGEKVKSYFDVSSPDYSDSEGYYEDGSVADYYGIIRYARRANVPAVIVEHAFIDRSEDVQKLKDEGFLRQAGEADADAIASYFQLSQVSLSLSASEISIGQSFDMSVNSSSDLSGYRFNYVWAYRGEWNEWDSTVKREGQETADTSWRFTPLKPGPYTLYLDVVSPDGSKITLEREVYVDRDWSDALVKAPSSVDLGQSVTYSAEFSGSKDVSYNYVWQYDSSWDEWWSNVQSSGAPTTDDSCTFTPAKAGTYDLYIDVMYDQGRKKTLGPWRVTVNESFSCSGVSASPFVLLGDQCSFSAEVSGNTVGLTFNYVWSYEGGWDVWSSTLKETGEYTRDRSWNFTPDREGEYDLYVDVRDSRGQVKTYSARVTVGFDYSVFGVKCPSTVPLGEKVAYSPEVTGNTSGLSYNYVWSYEGSWDLWDSTVKRTGEPTSDTSWSFTPTKAGRYDLYVDVMDSRGSKETLQTTVRVDTPWTFKSVSVPGSVRSGEAFSVVPVVDGPTQGLSYNYVWCYEGSWDYWNSTVKETGSTTDSPTDAFTLDRAGRYDIYVDVTDVHGNTKTLSASLVVEGNSIMGESLVSAERMASYYKTKGKTYPVLYAFKGAATIDDFCQIVQEEAAAEGVRADVLFAQAMHETGWLQFGGSVSPDQCNFGGLGAVSSTVGGASFPDVRTGLRAQVQHLKAYASTDPLNNECVDP